MLSSRSPLLCPSTEVQNRCTTRRKLGSGPRVAAAVLYCVAYGKHPSIQIACEDTRAIRPPPLRHIMRVHLLIVRSPIHRDCAITKNGSYLPLWQISNQQRSIPIFQRLASCWRLFHGPSNQSQKQSFVGRCEFPLVSATVRPLECRWSILTFDNKQ